MTTSEGVKKSVHHIAEMGRDGVTEDREGTVWQTQSPLTCKAPGWTGTTSYEETWPLNRAEVQTRTFLSTTGNRNLCSQEGK